MPMSDKRPAPSLAAASAAKPRESVREILTDVARRRSAEIAGVALLASATLFAIALMS
jgi:hypothetical protein